MRNPFARSAKQSPNQTAQAAEPRQANSGDAVAALCSIHERIDAGIEAEMAKQMDPNIAISINNYGENEGDGFFGREFELRETVARLKSLYAREPWIYTASSLVARTLSSVPMRAYDKRNNSVIPNHPLELLYKAGSDIEDGVSAQWAGDLDLDLSGNCFFVLGDNLRTYMHVPVELCTIKMADPKVDGRIGLQTLVISNPTTKAGGKQEINYKQVIHIKLPNPTNKFYGMSPWCAAARAVLLDRYKTEYDMAFYLRGATHTGVIETTEDMTKSRLERLMRTFEAAFTGRKNWWRPLFLPKGAKWVKSSPTMAEMQHLEGIKENRKVILAVRGVPGAMVGLVDDANRANMEAQMRVFWENTIVPMAMFIAAGWNNSYLRKAVYPNVELRPDFTGIEALQGSLISRGEQAKAVEGHWTLDEIRTKVYGLKPIGDERGNMLVAEITKPVLPGSAPGGEQEPQASNTPNMDAVASGTPPSTLPPAQAPGDTQPPPASDTPTGKRLVGSAVKEEATTSQNRIEDKLAPGIEQAYATYLDQTLSQAARAIADHRDVRRALKDTAEHRVATYWQGADTNMIKAMERSFNASQANVRCVAGEIGTKRMAYEFTEADRQAIEVLKERTQDGRRKLMASRGITRFAGHDANVTEQIAKLVEQGQANGQSWSDIAKSIRDDYEEAYPNQANTVVRTELLSAVSEGFKWNQDALNTLFDKVEQQWLHQGDVGSNPNARVEHAGFEDIGIVEAGYEFAPGLAYPRDPRAEAGEIINCRCSIVSVIPHDATSNANTILETEF